MNKTLISILCMVLIISLPFSSADHNQFHESFEPQEFPDEQTAEEFIDGQDTSLVINVNRYEPEVLVTSLLEEQSVPIYAYLSAVPTESLDFPRIQNIQVSVVGGNKSYFGGAVHRPPKVYSWEDLGAVEVRLKKIVKEDQVPERLDLDLKARITYEAESTSPIIGGQQTFVLEEKPVVVAQADDLYFDEASAVYGGRAFIRADSVTSSSSGRGSARFVVYDAGGKRINTFSVSEGSDSREISIVPGSNNPEDVFRIRVDRVIDCTKDSVEIDIKQFETSITEEGFTKHIVNEGLNILGWETQGIQLTTDKCVDETGRNFDFIYLRNRRLAELVILVRGTSEYIERELYGKPANLEHAFSCIKALSSDENEKNKIFAASKEAFLDLKRSWGEFEVQGFKGGVIETAELSVGGVKKNYQKNEQVTLGGYTTDCTPELNKCVLTDLNKNSGSVVIKHPIKLREGSCDVTSTRLYGEEYAALTNVDRFGVPDRLTTISSPNCDKPIELISIRSEKSVQISVLPGKKRGVTDTTFSLHIPVEKRLIKLNPRSLDKKINKTEELIEKLDGTISKLDKIVESWSKVCLATTAVILSWNFITRYNVAPTEKKTEIDAAKEAKDILARDGFGLVPSENPKFQRLIVNTHGEGSGFLYDNPTDHSQSRIIYIYENNLATRYVKRSESYDEIPANSLMYTQNIDGSGSKIYRYDATAKKIELYNGQPLLNHVINRDVDDEGRTVLIIPILNPDILPTRVQRKYVGSPGEIGYRDAYGEAKNGMYAIYYQNDRVEFYQSYGKGIDKVLQYSERDDVPLDTFYKTGDNLNRDIYNQFESRFVQPISTAQKRGSTNVPFGGDVFKLDATSKFASDKVNCSQVLGPIQCRALFNACDPVMCPPSRCDLNNEYQVDNVIASGMLGSLMLCLPNFGVGEDSVLVPICISGVLASLKNIRTYLQAYVQCLKTAKVKGESVGLCDKFRSIFMCEVIWKEAMTLLSLKGGLVRGLFNKIGSGATGGEEYLEGRFEQAENTVEFFTNDYATTVFAAYRGKSTKEIGAEICKNAIGGKFPNIGELVDDLAKPENPIQFTAYFEEHEYSSLTKQSRYQVYFHIYSGTPRSEVGNTGVNYYVFLKSPNTPELPVPRARGNLRPDQFVDESIDFLGAPGYQEICVAINGKVDCGFGKVVSTDFAINKLADTFITPADDKITKADQCVATTGGYIPNVAVKRQCSLSNPYRGLGLKKEQEWFKVGTCGTNEKGVFIGDCWEQADLSNPRYTELRETVAENSCESVPGRLLCESYQYCKGGAVEELGGGICCLGGTCEDLLDHKEIDEKIALVIGEFGSYSSVVSEALSYVEGHNGYFEDQISGVLPDNLAFVSLGTINSGNTGPVAPPPYKNQYHYFRGLVHIKYGNLKDAQLELRQIDSTSKYKGELQKWINDADAAVKGARGSSVSSTVAPLSIAASLSATTSSTAPTTTVDTIPKAFTDLGYNLPNSYTYGTMKNIFNIYYSTLPRGFISLSGEFDPVNDVNRYGLEILAFSPPNAIYVRNNEKSGLSVTNVELGEINSAWKIKTVTDKYVEIEHTQFNIVLVLVKGTLEDNAKLYQTTTIKK